MKEPLSRFLLCIFVFGFCLYSYLNAQNEVTHLKMRIPQVERDTKLILEENKRLAYEIDMFENPSHLLELARLPEYAHLKHPLLQEIVTVPESSVAVRSPLEK